MSASEFFPTWSRLHRAARRTELSQQRASAAASARADAERQQRLAITWARNGGYRDGYAGEPANVPAWDSIPEWSNAYAEGYALGAKARRKIRPHLNQQKELTL